MKPIMFSSPYREQRRPYGVRPPKNAKRTLDTPPQSFKAAVREMTEKYAHDPAMLRKIKVISASDAELRTAIAHEGVTAYQTTLASLRAGLEQNRKTIAVLRARLISSAQRLQQLEFERDQFREVVYCYKYAKRLNATILEIARLNGERNAAYVSIARCEAYLRAATSDADRLSAALTDMLLAAPAAREETVALPIEIKPHLNIEVKLPPAEVNVSLPARRTVTDIERDRAGNIVRAEQLETDA